MRAAACYPWRMLDRLADLLLRHGRVRRFDVGAPPADVLMQGSLVLRGLGAAISRLDLDGGMLEARLAVGGVLRLHAEADDDRSHVAIDVAGRDWGGVARVLARELTHGGGA
jgi:hypothetical protein